MEQEEEEEEEEEEDTPHSTKDTSMAPSLKVVKVLVTSRNMLRRMPKL